jgi:hypothetical protein
MEDKEDLFENLALLITFILFFSILASTIYGMIIGDFDFETGFLIIGVLIIFIAFIHQFVKIILIFILLAMPYTILIMFENILSGLEITKNKRLDLNCVLFFVAVCLILLKLFQIFNDTWSFISVNTIIYFISMYGFIRSAHFGFLREFFRSSNTDENKIILWILLIPYMYCVIISFQLSWLIFSNNAILWLIIDIILIIVLLSLLFAGVRYHLLYPTAWSPIITVSISFPFLFTETLSFIQEIGLNAPISIGLIYLFPVEYLPFLDEITFVMGGILNFLLTLFRLLQTIRKIVYNLFIKQIRDY